MIINDRSSHPELSCQKDVLNNFAKFRGKHLCHSLFLINLQASGLARVKNSFFHRTTPVAAATNFTSSINPFIREKLKNSIFEIRKTSININNYRLTTVKSIPTWVSLESLLNIHSKTCWWGYRLLLPFSRYCCSKVGGYCDPSLHFPAGHREWNG